MGPCHGIWRHRSRSTLAQVIFCWLATPSLYPKKCDLMAFTWEQFHRECWRYQYLIWSWKILIHKLQPHLPGANGLKLCINTLRPRQNGRHFADIFKRIFLNENIKISLKFVPKGSFNNISALVQIMAWRRPGDKPLSESMMVNLPTHICVTRPQWVNERRYYHLLGNTSTSTRNKGYYDFNMGQ